MSRREDIAAQLRKRPLAVDCRKALEMPSLVGMKCHVQECWIHPWKSLRGINMAHGVRIGPYGLQSPWSREPVVGLVGNHYPHEDELYDRMALLAVMEAGSAQDKAYDAWRLSAREIPGLHRIAVSKTDTKLCLDADGLPTLSVQISDLYPRASGQAVAVRMYPNSGVRLALKMGGGATEWFQQFLTRLPREMVSPKIRPEQVRALVFPENAPNVVDPEHSVLPGSRMLGTDGGQVLVASESTLLCLNRLMIETHGDLARRVPMRAFRPNIVLRGLPPFAEMFIRTLRLRGGAKLHLNTPCVRCKVTRLHPEGGEEVDREPTDILKDHTPFLNFGMNAEVEGGVGTGILIGEECVVECEG